METKEQLREDFLSKFKNSIEYGIYTAEELETVFEKELKDKVEVDFTEALNINNCVDFVRNAINKMGYSKVLTIFKESRSTEKHLKNVLSGSALNQLVKDELEYFLSTHKEEIKEEETFIITEKQSLNSDRKGRTIRCKNLESAKTIATQCQCFQRTFMTIEDEKGTLLAYKEDGGAWTNGCY